MKGLLSFIALAALCGGCAVTSGTRTLPDGSTLTIRSSRFLWISEGVKVRTQDQNGFEFSLEMQKTSPDAATMGAIAEGAARGAKAL